MPGSSAPVRPVIALKALAVWAGILLLAMFNGVLREACFLPHFGTKASFILSGTCLAVIILTVTYLFLPWLGARLPGELMAIGLGWLVLTLGFEFSFGLWQGKSWEAVLDAYSFKDGNLWPAVLVVTVIAPYVAGKLRGWV